MTLSGLDHLADMLRRSRSRQLGLPPSSIPFDALKDSEREMWLERARAAAASTALASGEGQARGILTDPEEAA